MSPSPFDEPPTAWSSSADNQKEQKEEFKLWEYNPSVPAASVATVVCGLLTFLHAFRLVINRKNQTGFCIPFLIGGVLEIVGYAARAGAHDNTESVTPYIIQSLLILLAPIFFAASIYAILGRLIRRVNGEDISIVHPSVLTRFFVFGDILCFMIQSGGGGMLAQAKKQSDVNFGNNVILVGLGLQIYIFCFFVKVAASFHRDLLQNPTVSAVNGKFPWQRYMILLYMACACVGIRNTYRVVEYAMGKDGFFIIYEWPLYVGDFALMAITLIVCLAWYDPNITPRNKL